jgi:hypothetical protein
MTALQVPSVVLEAQHSNLDRAIQSTCKHTTPCKQQTGIVQQQSAVLAVAPAGAGSNCNCSLQKLLYVANMCKWGAC